MTDTATITINGVHFEVQVPRYLAQEIESKMEQGSTRTLKRKFGERVAESIRRVIPVEGTRSSTKQIDYAIAIAHCLKLDLPLGILNREICSKFISKNVDEFKQVDPVRREKEKSARSIFKLVTRAFRLRKARKLIDEGVAIEEVAKQMDVTPPTIKDYLTELLEIESLFEGNDSAMLEKLLGELGAGIDIYEKHLYDPTSPY